MASIEDVISRSRQPGEFTERKRFTVERGSAIRKMRKFALADPYYYILELIQASIANGGQYIDIQVGKGDVTISYVGGGFTGDQLAQIFDFLFAAKSDLDIADIRQLALGINALMLAEPSKIIIESGKGSLESTTRVEIDGRSNHVDVGTPTEALDGTYIRCVSMNRRKLGKGSELAVIESRCLTSPVPILYNDEPLFGYRTMRTPNLMGYRRVVSFDEGDLYGTIGLATTENTNAFKLLTFGVWAESVKQVLVEGQRIGGVVCFDRLRKTADHNGIVKDAVFEELWARVRPYARELIDGKSGRAHFNIKMLDGTEVDAVKIRSLAKENPRLLVFSHDQITDKELPLAAEFGHVLGAPVFLAEKNEIRTLELIASEFAIVMRPELTANELEFYKRPLASEPATPWITGAIPIELTTVGHVVDAGALEAAQIGVMGLLRRIPRDVTIQSTVYTPMMDHCPGKLVIEVRVAERLIEKLEVESGFPGHVLVIDMGDVSPTLLMHSDRPRFESGHTVATVIAHVVHEFAAEALHTASAAVVDATNYREFDGGSAASRIIMAAVARGTMKSVGLDPKPQVKIQRVGDLPYGILNHHIFVSLTGNWCSLMDVVTQLNRQHGLVYGVLEGVEPELEGIDASCVLRLDEQQEAALISVFGEASYVRIDERDVLAEFNGRVVRDIALGVRPYSARPLLIEDGEGVDQDTIDALVGQLKRVFMGTGTLTDEEARRQAARHLIWYLLHAEPDHWNGVEHLPLFVLETSAVVSWSQLMEEFDDGVRMVDGWAVDAASLGAIIHEGRGTVDAYSCLAMNPFVFLALAECQKVRAAYEDVDRMSFGVEHLARCGFVREDVSGTLEIPKEEPEYPVVVVIEEGSKRAWTLRGPGRELGVTGQLTTKRVLDEESIAAVQAEVMQAGAELLLEAFEESRKDDDSATKALLPRIFAFAGHRLSLRRAATGKVSVSVNSWEAQKILGLPMFPSRHGGWTHAMSLVRAFTLAYEFNEDPSGWQTVLAEDADTWMTDWCQRFLRSDLIARPASRSAEIKASQPASRDGSEVLSHWLTAQIAALRPDLDGPGIDVIVVPPDSQTWKWRGNRMQIGRGSLGDLQIEPDGSAAGLIVVDDHWLVENALSEPDGEARVWLLMACYAYVNEMLEIVTNAHELAFQADVISRFCAT